MPLFSLPYDVLSDLILPLLPPPSLLSFSLVSKACRDLIYSEEDSPRLWRQVYLQSFDPPSSTVSPESFNWRGEVESRWRASTDIRSLAEVLGEGFRGILSPRAIRFLKHQSDDVSKWEVVMARLAGEPSLESWISTFNLMAPLSLDEQDPPPSTITLDYLMDLLPAIMSTLFPHLASQTVLLAQQRPPPPPRTSVRPTRSPSYTYAVEGPAGPSNYSPTHLPVISHVLSLLPPPSSSLSTSYRSLCRGLIYSFRTHGRRTGFGPFLAQVDYPDVEKAEGWKINWPLVRSIYHSVGENVREWELGRGQMIDSDDDEEEFRQVGVPRGVEDVRSVLDSGREVDEEWDWAGVEGRWTRIVCFMDYVDLFAFNFLPSQFTAALNTSSPVEITTPISYFDEYVEATRILRMKLTISHYASSSSGRHPVIHFTGIMVDVSGEQVVHHQGGSELTGSAEMMDEGAVRWRFLSRRAGSPLWSSEAVQPFGPLSRRGLFGLWTGVHHEEQDPIGPFWMWKDEIQP